MKFSVVLGLGILSILIPEIKSQIGDNGGSRADRVPLSQSDDQESIVSRASAGSKYHGTGGQGPNPSDSEVEPSLMRFSFLQPPPGPHEFPRYNRDGHSQIWPTHHQQQVNHYPNQNWKNQPPRQETLSLSTRLHPPPEPSQFEDSPSIFENRPPPIRFNPYIRENRPPLRKEEQYSTSGGRGVDDSIGADQGSPDYYDGTNEEVPIPQDYSPGTAPQGGHPEEAQEEPETYSEAKTDIRDETQEPSRGLTETGFQKSLQPLNLAALLAGAGTIGASSNPTEEPPTPPRRDIPQSKSLPRHPSPSPAAPDPEYYDTLYDEFVDTYSDPDAAVVAERDLNQPEYFENSDPLPEDNDASNKGQVAQVETTSKRTLSTTTSTSTSTSTAKTSKLTSTASTSTTTRRTPSTTSESTTKSSDTTQQRIKLNIPPISLSEVLQEMGIALPEFLGTLKEHGTSLKDFTTKLQEKSLSKLDFRRTKGDLKKMFEMIDGIPNQPTEASVPTTTTATSSVTTKSTLTLKVTTSEAVESRELVPEVFSTTIPSSEVVKPTRPGLTFGSIPSGIGLISKQQKENKNLSDSPTSKNDSKAPIAIKLDITSLMKDNGVSAADMLQDFGSMFNVSEIIEPKEENAGTPTTTKEKLEDVTKSHKPATTVRPRLTTLPIRPYYAEPEKPKSHRPLGYEHGWWNKDRDVINSRLGSTERPTIRPPYVPRPPKVLEGGILSGEAEFGSAIVVDKSKPTTVEKDSSTDPTKKRNAYQNSNSRNIYSKIRNGDPEALGMATRSAIMAAGILGGVALSVFIAIFIVVKYRSHMHRHRRRTVLTLPSDSSTSSIPPIYATRGSCIGFSKESYRTSGFWNTLKKRFDPYSLSSSPTSIRDSYIYSER